MNASKKWISGLCAALWAGLMPPVAHASNAGEAEVLHFWTSGGEAKSVEALKTLLAQRGYTWKDFVVVGGAGGNAMVTLKQRVTDGLPPAAAAIKGPAIQEWATQSKLNDLDVMAQFDKWDEKLPKVIVDLMKYKGHYVAVPINIHRVNWLWSNNAVLKKAGVAAPPKTLDEFFAAADKVKAAGFVPLAHGDQDWQDATVFEAVAMAVGGPGFFDKALLQQDKATLGSEPMRKTLETYRRMKSYTDAGASGRDWNVATDMVIKGKAAFQIMGDWAKGEFLVANQKPGTEFSCTVSPGTGGSFLFVVDSLVMFQLKLWESQKAQGFLAYQLMQPVFQEQFNLRKGSIPANTQVPLDKFDSCAQTSGKDFLAAAKDATLLPSIAHGMALSSAQQAALKAVVTEFWQDDKMSVADAQAKLVALTNPAPANAAAKK